MIRVGLGQAEHIDTRTAVESAISQCRQNLGGAHPQAGIVFAGVNFDHRLMLDEIRSRFPGINVIGCTTAGEFSSSYGFSDDSIILMVFASDEVEIGIGVGRSLTENPEAAIQAAVAEASAKLSKPVSICLAFPDWSSRSFDLIMKTLNMALGHDCPVFGGVAGSLYDDNQAPLQFYRGEVLADAMPIIGPVPGIDDAFVIGSVHSGYTSAPYMGRLLADSMLGKEPAMPLFPMDRLLTGTTEGVFA